MIQYRRKAGAKAGIYRARLDETVEAFVQMVNNGGAGQVIGDALRYLSDYGDLLDELDKTEP